MADRFTLHIVSLNTWGGNVLDPLLQYVSQLSHSTDLFCFQEVLRAPGFVPLECGFRTDLYDHLAAALPEFEGQFNQVVGWDQPRPDQPEPLWVPFGLATFVRRSLPILDRGCEPIIEHDDSLDAVPGLYRTHRQLQWTRFPAATGSLLVANFHGMARPGTKLDTDERIEQSRAIRRVMDRHDGPSLLVGDFNLLPETESVRMLAAGRRNLIAEYGIQTTRSRLNTYYGTPEEQPHANYAFATSDLAVESFTVPYVEVSDHLPMVLTVSA